MSETDVAAFVYGLRTSFSDLEVRSFFFFFSCDSTKETGFIVLHVVFYPSHCRCQPLLRLMALPLVVDLSLPLRVICVWVGHRPRLDCLRPNWPSFLGSDSLFISNFLLDFTLFSWWHSYIELEEPRDFPVLLAFRWPRNLCSLGVR